MYYEYNPNPVSRRLREMMEEAPDESVKREIERLADRMESM